jgi:hypothetical protein
MGKKTYDIAVLKGDGIGIEVIDEALKVLGALEKKRGPACAFTEYPSGAGCSLEQGTPLPADTLAACRRAEAVLLGADFLFKAFPLRRLTAEIYEFAEPTLALAQAMGAEEVGFMPEHFWHEDRHWGVHFMMLTRETWSARRRDFAGVIDLQTRFDGVQPAAQRPNGRGS